MGKLVYLSMALIYLCSCVSVPDREKSGIDELPKFTYVDGLLHAKTINCSSKLAKNCMACALQGEAADQPARGIYAVGVTIMTRAKGNINRVCKVTKARGQFEGMRRRGKMKISKKVWKVTEKIIEHKETGWTHFWAPKAQAKLRRRKPAWAHTYEKLQCKKEQIGDHIFFNKNQCLPDKKRSIASDNEF